MQVFEGVHQMYDVFAHQNVEFWSTLMVAYNTTGFISCAGTNFAIRASALRALGKSHCWVKVLEFSLTEFVWRYFSSAQAQCCKVR